MRGTRISLALIGAVTFLSVGCATRAYVREQVQPTQAQLAQTNQRVDAQETQLKQTSSLSETSRMRLDTLDGRMGETQTTANRAAARAEEAAGSAAEANRKVDSVSEQVRDLDGRLTARIANRNKFSSLDTRSIFFDSGKSDLKDEGMTMLLEVAKALKEDPNAIVELRGHTDGVGNERQNVLLSRERVDAVVRYLVQKEGVELRRIHSVGLGKAVPVADNNTREGRAKNRRVDVTLLSPQS
jgi:outer membrane protein OmpA-like peptidoglycan-associated protein